MKEIEGLPVLVMTLVIIGVALGVGIYTLSTLSTNIKDSITVTNEQITASNSTYTGVTYPPISSVTSVYNATDATDSVATANISYTDDGILISDDKFNGLTVNVSYVGKENTSASNSVTSVVTSVGNIPTWLTIIVVVAMAAIVLGLIMGAFSGKPR